MSLLQKIEEKRNKKIKEDRNKKVAIATAGIATGAIVGTIAGVLIAPKSGKETIEDTKSKVKESKMKIKEYLDERKSKKSESEIVEIEPLKLVEDTQVDEENLEA